jgi:hypothetical protein
MLLLKKDSRTPVLVAIGAPMGVFLLLFLKLTITSSNRLLSHLRARASPGNVKYVLQ